MVASPDNDALQSILKLSEGDLAIIIRGNRLTMFHSPFGDRMSTEIHGGFRKALCDFVDNEANAADAAFSWAMRHVRQEAAADALYFIQSRIDDNPNHYVILQEGPWTNEKDALEFLDAEVGAESQVVRIDCNTEDVRIASPKICGSVKKPDYVMVAECVEDMDRWFVTGGDLRDEEFGNETDALTEIKHQMARANKFVNVWQGRRGSVAFTLKYEASVMRAFVHSDLMQMEEFASTYGYKLDPYTHAVRREDLNRD